MNEILKLSAKKIHLPSRMLFKGVVEDIADYNIVILSMRSPRRYIFSLSTKNGCA